MDFLETTNQAASLGTTRPDRLPIRPQFSHIVISPFFLSLMVSP